MKRDCTKALSLIAGGIAASLMLGPASAWAYAPKWLECDGQKVTTEMAEGKSQTATAPAKDFYVYDDDSKNLYKYSEARKSEDIEPVTLYTDKEIKWAGKGSSLTDANWEGQLNRATLALQLNYREKGLTIVWNQQCKPTAARTK